MTLPDALTYQSGQFPGGGVAMGHEVIETYEQVDTFHDIEKYFILPIPNSF